MNVPKIYLETTLFNFYFDKDRDAHQATVKLFEEIAEGKYAAYTSRYTIDELEKAPTEKSEKMLSLIEKYSIAILEANIKSEQLAQSYVDAKIIPVGYGTDALHIAIASVSGLDMIISTNFKHIVKLKTIAMTNALNVLNGYGTIKIHSPLEVVEDDEEG